MHKQPRLESFLESIEDEREGLKEDMEVSDAAQEVLSLLEDMKTEKIIEIMKFALRGIGDTLGLKAANALNNINKTSRQNVSDFYLNKDK